MDECAATGADGSMTDYPDRKRESIDQRRITVVEAESTTHHGGARIDNTGLHFKLSGGGALCSPGQPGDDLALPFRTEKTDAIIECVLVRRPGGAVVDLYVDDQLRIEKYDTEGPSPSRQTIRLGAVGHPGHHELRIVPVAASGDSSLSVDVIVVRDPRL